MADTEKTTRGFRAGRMFGAPIIISPFTLVMIAVLAFTRASNDIEGVTAATLGRGVVFAVLLFVAVFLHELAHAGVARAFKRRVDEIVLSILGGHTAIDSRGLTPLVSGVTSIAGPVSNLVLGALSLAVSRAMAENAATPYVAWFGYVNILLAIFNAIPALPLDGGHVFEAIVWGISGRRRPGTIAAGWAGRLLAIAVPVYLVALPVLRGEVPSTFTIVWALFIAAIFWPAASAALRRASVESRLSDLAVATLMRPAIGVGSRYSVGAALGEGLAAYASHVVVLSSDGAPAGHFPLENAAQVPEDRQASTSIGAVALPLPRGAQIGTDVAGAAILDHIREWWGKTEVLAVMDEGTVVGVVRLVDAVERLKG